MLSDTLKNFDWGKWERERKWNTPDAVIVDYFELLSPPPKSKIKRQLEIFIRKKKIKEILED